ncbi:VOC family protein [Agaribacter marinus]|uniref:VOC domain-containing protein n=1 Tax=Agaribacter marinus TaxID=1431249 RepID=A0AA37T586_9ALTE|nr:VOC family protein [Agaribacter marinus]GLR72218.1 hypothetical protein GCM10007852_31260 [Agaribacter marinus]
MISHVTIGVKDFTNALKFYSEIMSNLGFKQRFCDYQRPWAGWQSNENARPLFIITVPVNGDLQSAGNGQMIALLAKDPAMVDSTYKIAVRNGGQCAGKPGLRPEYHEGYYGAYFKDLDSNKICIVNHNACA